MGSEKRKKRNIISNIFTILIIIIAVLIYSKYDFNYYTKGVEEKEKTLFSRDSQEKYSTSKSYKIENKEENDAMFYREIEVKKNTPYKVTCMIKTKNVQSLDQVATSGAQICLKDTEEHSVVLTGDNDWTQVDFLFNSKNNDTVEIGFRLGGNYQQASGTAWFADLKIEEGIRDESNYWNFGCFILDNISVTVEGKIINTQMSSYEKSLVTTNMQRLQNSIKIMSGDKIEIGYDIIEITDPLTTLSYDEENGYYISEKDVYKLINEYVQEKEYDHIYICTNLPLESQLTSANVCEWVGLGNMQYVGKGLSNIRITKEEYEYTSYNNFPEEVFLHEFLHTLERNSEEYGYKVPELHDYRIYGYEDERVNGQRKWYIDYMNKNIEHKGNLIGLPEEIYLYSPIKQKDFEYSYKLDKLDEPKGIKENIEALVNRILKLFEKKETNTNSIKGVA